MAIINDMLQPLPVLISLEHSRKLNLNLMHMEFWDNNELVLIMKI